MTQRRDYLKGMGLSFLATLAGCTNTDNSVSNDTEAEEETGGEEMNANESEAETNQQSDGGNSENETEDNEQAYENIDQGELEEITQVAVEEEAQTANEGNQTGESTEPNEQAPDLSGTIRAQIGYDEEWMLAYSTRRRTGSFGRSGRQTVEIDDDVDVVSVAVQKADKNDTELTVLLLLDEQIVADTSTTEPLGITQVTYTATQ